MMSMSASEIAYKTKGGDWWGLTTEEYECERDQNKMHNNIIYIVKHIDITRLQLSVLTNSILLD